MDKPLFIFVFIVLLFESCKPLPKKVLYQFDTDASYEVIKDSLFISLANPLKCPLRIAAASQAITTQKLLKTHFPIVLKPESDTLLSYNVSLDSSKVKISFSMTFGDLNDTIKPKEMSLPFPNGYWYRVIQGYNGSFSHQSDYSRYAIDFALAEGDTICAADSGFVVGVIDGYKYGGNNKKWRNYANYITIFHPQSNLFTQYVHLTYEGSFVEVGDFVKMGESIGLSGKTGYTNVEHLHFNVLLPSEDGMKSYKVAFKEGYKGEDLGKNAKAVKR